MISENYRALYLIFIEGFLGRRPAAAECRTDAVADGELQLEEIGEFPAWPAYDSSFPGNGSFFGGMVLINREMKVNSYNVS